MAFCDFCTCEDCKTGNTSLYGMWNLTHAQCEDARWICSTCYIYHSCPGGRPCDNDKNCNHRPKLVSEWTFWTWSVNEEQKLLHNLKQSLPFILIDKLNEDDLRSLVNEPDGLTVQKIETAFIDVAILFNKDESIVESLKHDLLSVDDYVFNLKERFNKALRDYSNYMKENNLYE